MGWRNGMCNLDQNSCLEICIVGFVDMSIATVIMDISEPLISEPSPVSKSEL